MPDDPDIPKNPPRAMSFRGASWIVPIAVLLVAGWLLRHYLAAMDWHDVATAWSRLPSARIAASIAATGVSMCMLAAFDVVAVGTAVPGRISVGLAAFAGVVAHALSNTLGFPALTGGAVRYRIYASAGLTAGDIARIVGLAGLGVGLGFAVVTTAALLWEPAIARGWGRLPGVALFLALAALLGWLAVRPRTLRIANWTLAWPTARTTAMQMAMGGVEMTAAVAALYVLLPPGSAPPFVDFLPIYVAAVLAGVVSHVPGGLGVFETIMLASFPPAARADLLAAMLCYRLTYSLLPFSLAAAALTAFEWRRRVRETA
jgi:phosphatidylglycerol lysyltransferase